GGHRPHVDQHLYARRLQPVDQLGLGGPLVADGGDLHGRAKKKKKAALRGRAAKVSVCAERRQAARASPWLRRRAAAPIIATPRISMAQVAGSGMGVTRSNSNCLAISKPPLLESSTDLMVSPSREMMPTRPKSPLLAMVKGIVWGAPP